MKCVWLSKALIGQKELEFPKLLFHLMTVLKARITIFHNCKTFRIEKEDEADIKRSNSKQIQSDLKFERYHDIHAFIRSTYAMVISNGFILEMNLQRALNGTYLWGTNRWRHRQQVFSSFITYAKISMKLFHYDWS